MSRFNGGESTEENLFEEHSMGMEFGVCTVNL